MAENKAPDENEDALRKSLKELNARYFTNDPQDKEVIKEQQPVSSSSALPPGAPASGTKLFKPWKTPEILGRRQLTAWKFVSVGILITILVVTILYRC